jgi:hypothetical protein
MHVISERFDAELLEQVRKLNGEHAFNVCWRLSVLRLLDADTQAKQDYIMTGNIPLELPPLARK